MKIQCRTVDLEAERTKEGGVKGQRKEGDEGGGEGKKSNKNCLFGKKFQNLIFACLYKNKKSK